MSRNTVEVVLSMGRFHLKVNGYIVATEGDVCRDDHFAERNWTREMLEAVATAPLVLEAVAAADFKQAENDEEVS